MRRPLFSVCAHSLCARRAREGSCACVVAKKQSSDRPEILSAAMYPLHHRPRYLFLCCHCLLHSLLPVLRMHFCIWCACSQVCMLGCGLCTRSSAFELSPTMAAQTQRYRSKSSQSMCSLPVLCPCLSVLFMSSSAHTSARALSFHDFLPMSLSPRAPPCVRGRIVAQTRSLCFLPLRGSRFCLPPLVVLGTLALSIPKCCACALVSPASEFELLFGMLLDKEAPK